MPYGAEGRLTRLTVREKGEVPVIVATAAFRIDNLAASVTLVAARVVDAGDAAELGRLLAERIEGVRSGTVTRTETVRVSFKVQALNVSRPLQVKVSYLDPDEGRITETVSLPWESETFEFERGTVARLDAADGDGTLSCGVDLAQGPYGRTSSGACPLVREL